MERKSFEPLIISFWEIYYLSTEDWYAFYIKMKEVKQN
jgi:hypothetical protein